MSSDVRLPSHGILGRGPSFHTVGAQGKIGPHINPAYTKNYLVFWFYNKKQSEQTESVEILFNYLKKKNIKFLFMAGLNKWPKV